MSNNNPQLSTRPYKGTRDFYPQDMRVRNYVFQRMKSVARSFGYEEYDGPMLEMFDLYAAKSGDELVKDQLYHFMDRGGRHVAIRPEMTPTVARMVAARLQQLPRPIRWFSIPNLWRYEQPQHGRLREHWQLNVDIFGSDSVAADQEIIEVAIEILRSMGANEKDFKIHISNRRMLSHFLEVILELPQEVWSPVCRAIDKKAKVPVDVFHGMLSDVGLAADQIQKLQTYMDLGWENLTSHEVYESAGAKELVALFTGLRNGGYEPFCQLDLSIVRGLDYYTGTVFEMYDTSPENKRAMFGGGRYDNLVGLFNNNPVSGVGFGMGDVTILHFLNSHDLLPSRSSETQVLIALFDEASLPDAMQTARSLRAKGFRAAVQLDAVKLGKQFKTANQKGIPIVLIRGPDEQQNGTMSLKYLPTGEQTCLIFDEAVTQIGKWLKSD